MLTKKVFSFSGVIQYMYAEILWSFVLAATVFEAYRFFGIKIALPFSVAATMGSALAIFIAFRNNTSYSRRWEASIIWGNITQSSKILARLIITFTDSHAHQANYVPQRSEKFKKEMIYACIAWVHCLRMELRGEQNWQSISHFLEEKDAQALQNIHNKTNYLHLIMGKKIYEAMANGTLGGFDSFQMEGQLAALANHQAACERIRDTPLLRQYHFFTRLFLLVFMFILPSALLNDLEKMGIFGALIPISMLISFVFGVMAKVGEVNENPFEQQITDIPLHSLCNNIERNLKEMLGESELPPLVVAQNGVLS